MMNQNQPLAASKNMFGNGLNDEQNMGGMHNAHYTDLNNTAKEMHHGDVHGGDTDELDPEFVAEIETYLKECMENNELSIDMSDTLIKDHGAKMVAAAASLCDQLQELRLQQCGISDEGALAIFEEIRGMFNLQVIDLSFNNISEKSLEGLALLLNSNPNLVVNMRMNNIKNKFAARKL